MIKIIEEVSKDDLMNFLYDLDIKDDNLYKEMNNPHSLGIFQMNGGLAGQFVSYIKPKNFNEIVAINSLARPGTSSFVDTYKTNRDSGKRQYHQKVNELLNETYGVILYQEQAMAIFNKIGGFSLEETNYIRGLMKKLGKAEKKEEDMKAWDKVVDRFKIGAKEAGLSDLEAKKLTQDILMFSGYSFNKSHAVAYSYIADMNLYLSYYFRKYFYCAVLHYEVNRDKDLLDKLRAVKMQGFDILPPSINKSKKFIAPSPDADNQILFGLADIKYVSEAIADVIIENRPYVDFVDYYLKTTGNRINIRTNQALASIGAFEEIEPERKKLKMVIEQFWEAKGASKVRERVLKVYNQVKERIFSLPGLETTQDDLREYEKEYLGFNFFITPFTDKLILAIDKLIEKGYLEKDFSCVRKSSAKIPVLVNAIRAFNDKNGKEMAFVEIEDITGERTSIPIFQSLWRFIKEEIAIGRIHFINLYRDSEDKIMFGRSGWVDSEIEIRRLVKRLDKS